MLKPQENQELSGRSRKILDLLIADYIATSDPVGSRQIAERLDHRLSPATIRNVMCDLEELGLLSKPHTSAGRIPTEKGLRYYVDTLIERRTLSEEEEMKIQDHYQVTGKDIRSFVTQTGKVLAEISKHAGLVLSPNWKSTLFKHIEFIPLSSHRLLGIFVSQDGMVENRILETNETLTASDLEKINNYCNLSFAGLSLDEAQKKIEQELQKFRQEYDRLLSKALLFSRELLDNIDETELVLETQANETLNTVQQLMTSIEEKQRLRNLLRSCHESAGIQIFIGNESQMSGAEHLSLVTANYHCKNRILGTVGIIGPMHMDYQSVIPMVDFTARLVSDFFER